ncbi:MAG: hypothetical protein HY781_10890 [Chloroflexi bacterium]|nr:hypothetical protein [Chloroflexota bacterium]
MKLKGLFSTAVAVLCGLVVLAGYFVRLDILVNASNTLITWAILLTAFAILLGIINLLIVHVGKITRKQKGGFYSIILIFAMLATFAIGLLAPHFPPASPAFDFAFRAVQLPVEASLMALLAVTLTYASIRLPRRRLSVFSVIFIITGLLVLLGTAPLPFLGDTPLVSDTLRPTIAQVLAASGARGILIGVALGALATGLRVLFGADRPYGGK